MTVRDPLHPLFGRTFSLAARRVHGRLARERILVFGDRGILLHLAPSALVAPDPDARRSRLTVEAVEELVATARRLGLVSDSPATEREEA